MKSYFKKKNRYIFLKILFIIIIFGIINIKFNFNHLIYKKNKINIMKKLNFRKKYLFFFYLKKRPNNLNSPLIKMEKKELLNMLSRAIGKTINKINSIFLSQKYKFGNQIILINMVIYYCEILGCKKIILNKNWNWFIRKKIKYKKYKMVIELGDRNDFKYDVLDISTNFFYYSKIFKPELRIEIIKNEILRNVPFVETNLNDLYIYIRSGDIFTKNGRCRFYSQPPLCFYKNIIDNFIFNKIFIIAKDRNNPVIDKLIKDYKDIIFEIKDIKKDIALLSYAYNLVGGVSTFFNIILRLNDNIRVLFEYNIDSIYAKIISFHYIFYKLSKKIKIYRMNPSDEYKNKMYIWQNSKYQRDLMINEKCINKFKLLNT